MPHVYALGEQTIIIEICNLLINDFRKLVLLYIDLILCTTYVFWKDIRLIKQITQMQLIENNRFRCNKNQYQMLLWCIYLLAYILITNNLIINLKQYHTIYNSNVLYNKTKLQEFMGMANYLRRFRLELATLVIPLLTLKVSTI